jgi:hypothetical protein
MGDRIMRVTHTFIKVICWYNVIDFIVRHNAVPSSKNRLRIARMMMRVMINFSLENPGNAFITDNPANSAQFFFDFP